MSDKILDFLRDENEKLYRQTKDQQIEIINLKRKVELITKVFEENRMLVKALEIACKEIRPNIIKFEHGYECTKKIVNHFLEQTRKEIK